MTWGNGISSSSDRGAGGFHASSSKASPDMPSSAGWTACELYLNTDQQERDGSTWNKHMKSEYLQSLHDFTAQYGKSRCPVKGSGTHRPLAHKTR